MCFCCSCSMTISLLRFDKCICMLHDANAAWSSTYTLPVAGICITAMSVHLHGTALPLLQSKTAVRALVIAYRHNVGSAFQPEVADLLCVRPNWTTAENVRQTQRFGICPKACCIATALSGIYAIGLCWHSIIRTTLFCGGAS